MWRELQSSQSTYPVYLGCTCPKQPQFKISFIYQFIIFSFLFVIILVVFDSLGGIDIMGNDNNQRRSVQKLRALNTEVSPRGSIAGLEAGDGIKRLANGDYVITTDRDGMSGEATLHVNRDGSVNFDSKIKTEDGTILNTSGTVDKNGHLVHGHYEQIGPDGQIVINADTDSQNPILAEAAKHGLKPQVDMIRNAQKQHQLDPEKAKPPMKLHPN